VNGTRLFIVFGNLVQAQSWLVGQVSSSPPQRSPIGEKGMDRKAMAKDGMEKKPDATAK